MSHPKDDRYGLAAFLLPRDRPWPDHEARIPLLGSDQKLRWVQTADALVAGIPAAKPCDYAYTLKVALRDG
ncbi:MAG: hypothetical protein ACRD2G_02500 [Terriglobia bacterium]